MTDYQTIIVIGEIASVRLKWVPSNGHALIFNHLLCSHGMPILGKIDCR
jgi:hypothetical protein